jgi:hypothetical protein
MRWILGILVVFVVLWTGYWFTASSTISGAVDDWFAKGAADSGIVAEKSASSVGGYPYRFDISVEGVSVADPVSGAGYAAPDLRVHAMAWQPWHVIASFADSQVITLPGQEIALTGQNLLASLRAQPSPDLALAEARVAGQEIAATSTLGWQSGAADLTLALRQEGPAAADYALGLSLVGLRPDPAFLGALAAVNLPGLPAPDYPAEAGPVRANILLHLSAPLDRHAGTARPLLLGLEIRELHLEWGALVARATGTVAPDAQGYAEGEIALEVANWDRLPALLVAMGAVRPEIAPTVGSMMRALAGETGDATTLRLPLRMTGGQMSLGPFPLGPAPLLLPPSG